MKRAIFVRSKMTIMAELEKRAREKGIYKEEFYKLKYCSTVVYMVPRA